MYHVPVEKNSWQMNLNLEFIVKINFFLSVDWQKQVLDTDCVDQIFNVYLWHRYCEV